MVKREACTTSSTRDILVVFHTGISNCLEDLNHFLEGTSIERKTDFLSTRCDCVLTTDDNEDGTGKNSKQELVLH